MRSLSGPILVTGHTGFKGAWLVSLLERLGFEVCGYSLEPLKDSLYERTKRHGIIEEEFGDIRDFEKISNFIKISKPSAVFHLAAQPLVSESYKQPKYTFETNVMGTVNLLSACLSANSISSVNVITTDKVYKNQNLSKKFKESDSLSGRDPYSASKVATESVIDAWIQISENLGGPNIFSCRAGNVIGGGDWSKNRLLPDLIRGFVGNQTIRVRHQNSTRPWQHVLDPLFGYVLALEESLNGSSARAYNFGPSGESLSVREVCDISIDAWGSEIEVHFDSEDNVNFYEAKFLDLDSTFAESTLNWRPKWTQEQAVRNTVEWWKTVLTSKMLTDDLINFEIDFLLS